MSETELMETQVRLKKNGDLVQRIEGAEVIVAHYDRATGFLEFATKEASVKLYNQVCDRIGSVNKGTQPSGLVIKSFGVKGEERPKITSKRPKAGPEGDGTPALVDWYIRNDLAGAIIRYGIYTDAQGKPVRKKVERTIERMIDGRDSRPEKKPEPEPGQSFEGGPIRRRKETIQVRNAIIARRATRYEDDPDVLDEMGVEKLEALFLPQEVVGGFTPEDEFDEIPSTTGGTD